MVKRYDKSTNPIRNTIIQPIVTCPNDSQNDRSVNLLLIYRYKKPRNLVFVSRRAVTRIETYGLYERFVYRANLIN